MKYKAKDGRMFNTVMQGRAYDRSLQESDHPSYAPGGDTWMHDLRQHGPVKQITITPEGAKRHVLQAVHADGYHHKSVHAADWRAHEAAGQMYGIEKPSESQTRQHRASAHPVGAKEKERMDIEDHRVPERPAQWEDFEL